MIEPQICQRCNKRPGVLTLHPEIQVGNITIMPKTCICNRCRTYLVNISDPTLGLIYCWECGAYARKHGPKKITPGWQNWILPNGVFCLDCQEQGKAGTPIPVPLVKRPGCYECGKRPGTYTNVHSIWFCTKCYKREYYDKFARYTPITERMWEYINNANGNPLY